MMKLWGNNWANLVQICPRHRIVRFVRELFIVRFVRELYWGSTNSGSSMISFIVRFMRQLYFSSTHKKMKKSKFRKFPKFFISKFHVFNVCRPYFHPRHSWPQLHLHPVQHIRRGLSPDTLPPTTLLTTVYSNMLNPWSPLRLPPVLLLTAVPLTSDSAYQHTVPPTLLLTMDSTTGLEHPCSKKRLS